MICSNQTQGSYSAIITSAKSGGAGSKREKALSGEELIERCRSIKSIREEIGV